MNSRIREKVDYLLGLMLFAILPFILAPSASSTFKVADLPEFYCGARLLLMGKVAAIYDLSKFLPLEKSTFPELINRSIPLYVAPYGLPFLLPYLLFPPQLAYLGMKVILIACFALALVLLSRWLRLNSRSFMWIAVVLPFFGPAWEAIRLEQTSPILLLSLAGCLLLLRKNRPLLAAAVFAPFMLKPNLAAPIWFFLLGAGRLRFCSSFLAIALVIILATLALCGFDAYKNYGDLLSYSMVNLHWMAPEDTPTFRGQLLRLPFLPHLIATQISMAVFFVVLLILCFAGYRLRRGDYLTSLVTIAVPLGCVFSVHCFAYDLILYLPALLVASQAVLARGLKSDLRLVRNVSFLLLPTLAFMLPFYIFIYYDFTLFGAVINWHFVCLLVLSLYLAWRGLVTD